MSASIRNSTITKKHKPLPDKPIEDAFGILIQSLVYLKVNKGILNKWFYLVCCKILNFLRQWQQLTGYNLQASYGKGYNYSVLKTIEVKGLPNVFQVITNNTAKLHIN